MDGTDPKPRVESGGPGAPATGSRAEVRLRPFGPEDYDRLASWLTTPFDLMVWGGSRFTLPLNAKQLDRYLLPTRQESPARLVYAAEAGGETIGHIELNAVSVEHSCATLCRVLIGDPAARGKGLGTAMVERILDIAFDELGLHRVDLNVYDQNSDAIACYEKTGFVQEGLLREARRFGDERWSLVHMSVLEPEWRKRRESGPS